VLGFREYGPVNKWRVAEYPPVLSQVVEATSSVLNISKLGSGTLRTELDYLEHEGLSKVNMHIQPLSLGPRTTLRPPGPMERGAVAYRPNDCQYLQTPGRSGPETV
jgi:hypothetical protein